MLGMWLARLGRSQRYSTVLYSMGQAKGPPAGFKLAPAWLGSGRGFGSNIVFVIPQLRYLTIRVEYGRVVQQLSAGASSGPAAASRSAPRAPTTSSLIPTPRVAPVETYGVCPLPIYYRFPKFDSSKHYTDQPS
jgi:hypothetical protein